MPRARKITGKKGVSYQLIAYTGYDTNGKQLTKTRTWTPPAGMTEKQAKKQAKKQADLQAQLFEDTINKGTTAFDGKIKFADYAATYMESAQNAPKTMERYVVLLRRINQAIGNLRLENIQPHHLEAFYKNLAEDNIKETGRHAVAHGLRQHMEKKKLTKALVAKKSGVSERTIKQACDGKRVALKSAECIAAALKKPIGKLFDVHKDTGGLSDVTVLHHHRLIAIILGKAKRARIIPHNVASEYTDAPRVRKKEAKYLDDEQAARMAGLLLNEPDIRIKTALLLFMYSGVRRGELGGLQWQDVDWKNRLIHIRRAIQWQVGKGVVEVPTKTESSQRPIRLPKTMMDVLHEYRQYWIGQQSMLGSAWEGDDWIFISDTGKPLAQNRYNTWLDEFTGKHGLPRITPHSLRHTFCSLQIAGGVNVRTVQARSGHSRASTLTDIYTHAFKTADELASDTLDDILTPQAQKKPQFVRQEA